ncbi:PREDICTED: probable ATP-dependent RNA helicase kurz [Wasmannia auropunctata]|uniref:probable ATP-dependent RNA helicase kurz n=1 Tax=Wasmannia auropunctata TaxID=64793 RepID=UPI0005EDBE0C|nr:PREDICTED: probable ATP-dependent RNA helicase kurz [Wasmannia auropunctata]
MDIEHPLTVNDVKWFAYFFLEGQVCSKLKRFVPSLLTTSGSIIKSWVKLIPRKRQAIVQTLRSQGVVSKDRLVEIWDSDKKFLLPEVAAGIHAKKKMEKYVSKAIIIICYHHKTI